MRILHYALGFPPYRSGGLTKFCIDLIRQQNMDKHQVALMWPGKMGFLSRKVLVKDRGIARINGIKSGIHSFELINPLPISYDEGIKEFDAFIKDGGSDGYRRLLDDYKPDVIHVHTLMGLHKSFLFMAKAKGIRLVFTAHDFFPICPKVTMFRHGVICGSIYSYEECGMCNITALSMKKIQILQLSLYRKLKDSIIVKKLRKKHRDVYLSGSVDGNNAEPVGTVDDFRRLRKYYYSMLQLMDIVHYNSTITKVAYEKVFNLTHNYVIGITHADIADNKKIKKFPDDFLHIRYLGPAGGAKGFFCLRRHLINYGRKDKIFV